MLRVLAAVGTAVTVLWLASAVDARQATPAPSGNDKGLALLRRVNAAYRRVPAVQTSGRVGSLRARFTLLLSKGVATAEEFVGKGPGGTTLLVARGTGPTFAREPGTSCWRRLKRTNSQSLEDLGISFPNSYRMLVRAPQRAGGVWLLTAASQGRYPGEKAVITMRIDASTLQVESETARFSGGHVVTEQVKALASRPRLATPTPSC